MFFVPFVQFKPETFTTIIKIFLYFDSVYYYSNYLSLLTFNG